MKFACPECNQQLELPDNYSGGEGICPSCNNNIRVPGSDGIVSSRRPSPAQLKDNVKPQNKICPFCSETILIQAKKCKYCQSRVSGFSSTVFVLACGAIFLIFIALACFAEGSSIYANAKSVMHQILGSIYYLISSICIASVFIMISKK